MGACVLVLCRPLGDLWRMTVIPEEQGRTDRRPSACWELLAGGLTPPFTLCWVRAGCLQAVSSQTHLSLPLFKKL